MTSLLRLVFITVFLFMCGCRNASKQKIQSGTGLTVVRNINDSAMDEKAASAGAIKKSGCIFLDPDTSLSHVILRDSKTAAIIMSDRDKMDDNDQYHYYSTMDSETLSITQFAGDGKYQVSVFKVVYSDKASHPYRQLHIDHFETEKGIKLGLHKQQIIEKLGNCYTVTDSTKNYIVLYYHLELPDDSKTRFLEENNMPSYYAIYTFRNDRLRKFEFGFEYP